MTEIRSQPVYYVALFTIKANSLEEVWAKVPEAMTTHIKRSNELHKKGKLLMAGAFRSSPEEPVSAMGVFYSREDAEEFVKGDPFVLNGIVSEWHVKEWANILKE
jgi:uncharacterized protein YciI